ncbi:hypothetical protein [Haloarchaeobius sp. TZWWS8]|uniref:hypothetical protein n=1 Tax=Haloarchaeobius sp. TZWWS8 TaxID=3446121 RepID=UPI003EBB379B
MGNIETGPAGEVEKAIEKSVVENDPDITDPSQVEVTDVQESTSPDGTSTFKGEVELTDSGQSRVQRNQQAAFDRLGSTGRELNRDIAQTQFERERAAFSRDVRGDIFAENQVRREAERNLGLDSGDLSVDFGPTGFGVSLSEGGRRRELKRSVAASSDRFDLDDLVTRAEDDLFTVEATDEAFLRELREDVAASNDDLDESDILARFPTEGEKRRRRATLTNVERATGKDIDVGELANEPIVSLTEEAEKDLLLSQAKEQFPNAELEVVEEDGDLSVKVGERFDDGDRFLGIEGLESDVENAADTTGDFLSGVGNAAGLSVGVPADLLTREAGLQGDDGTFFTDTGTAAGRGLASLANLPANALALDEAGEFIGASSARGLSSFETTPGVAGGPPVFSGLDEEILGDLSTDVVDSGEFMGGQIETQFRENPVEATAGVAGALVGSAALFRATGATTTAGRTSRLLVQPGEELFFGSVSKVPPVRGFAQKFPGGKLDFEELAVFGARKAGRRVKVAGSRARRRLGSVEVNLKDLPGDDVAQLGKSKGGLSKQKTIELTRDTTISEIPEEDIAKLNESTRATLIEREFEKEGSLGAKTTSDFALEEQAKIAREQMPPVEAFPSETEFESELEARIERMNPDLSATETDLEAEVDTELEAFAAELGGFGSENTSLAVDGLKRRSRLRAASESGLLGDLSQVEVPDVTTGLEAAASSSLLEDLRQIEASGIETVTSQSVEQSISQQIDLGLEQTRDVSLELEQSIETGLEIDTDIETKRKRKLFTPGLESDTDLFSESGVGDSFEKVFESDVASESEILSGRKPSTKGLSDLGTSLDIEAGFPDDDLI